MQLADVENRGAAHDVLAIRAAQGGGAERYGKCGAVLADEFDLDVVDLPFVLEAWKRLLVFFPGCGRDDVGKAQGADNFVPGVAQP